VSYFGDGQCFDYWACKNEYDSYVNPLDVPNPKCDDGMLNGEESDIDCGGSKCPACAKGKECRRASDCSGANICHLTTFDYKLCDDKSVVSSTTQERYLVYGYNAGKRYDAELFPLSSPATDFRRGCAQGGSTTSSSAWPTISSSPSSSAVRSYCLRLREYSRTGWASARTRLRLRGT
jgi:hypothetical protein